MRLEGRKVLIVGVSPGLGAATAYYLLNDGARVAIAARNEKKLRRITEMLSSYGKILSVKGDASSPEGAKKLVVNAKKALGGIDDVAVLVGGWVDDDIESLNGLDSMLDNHIKVPMYVVNATLPHLHRGSSVILISSSHALGRSPTPLSYNIGMTGSAKAVEMLAGELLKKGIRVNGVAPSSIDGDFKPGDDRRTERTLGDWKAPPDDFAKVIAWLLSEESEWVNGVVIPVDGGTRFKE